MIGDGIARLDGQSGPGHFPPNSDGWRAALAQGYRYIETFPGPGCYFTSEVNLDAFPDATDLIVRANGAEWWRASEVWTGPMISCKHVQWRVSVEMGPRINCQHLADPAIKLERLFRSDWARGRAYNAGPLLQGERWENGVLVPADHGYDPNEPRTFSPAIVLGGQELQCVTVEKLNLLLAGMQIIGASQIKVIDGLAERGYGVRATAGQSVRGPSLYENMHHENCPRDGADFEGFEGLDIRNNSATYCDIVARNCSGPTPRGNDPMIGAKVRLENFTHTDTPADPPGFYTIRIPRLFR